MIEIIQNFNMVEIVMRLAVSVLFGAAIGFEREYRSKAAGFRTITLITLGSALYTIMSQLMDTDGRVAANIITGIGFIGAGVIFKGDLGVSGLTTAAAIWVSAAVGVAVGVGEYFIAGSTMIASIIVLAGFEKLQDFIEDKHQVRAYKICFDPTMYSESRRSVEDMASVLGLSVKTKKMVRIERGSVLQCNVGGDQERLDKFSEFLLTAVGVKSFDET